jgi:hypothetical protein
MTLVPKLKHGPLHKTSLVRNEHKGNGRKALYYVDGERATRNAVIERHGTICPDNERS